MWEHMHVHVDQVLQGKGKSNTGGISKRVLEKPEEVAHHLELDKDLVVRLAKILSAFSCREPINWDLLETFCLETNKLFYEKYPWAEMRPTVHKYLVHGVQIVREFKYPPIFYAEDSIEHWHQLHRKNSRDHSRQNSRVNRLKDMFDYAVYCSDPAISLEYMDDRINLFKHDTRMTDISEFLLNTQDEEMRSVTDTIETDIETSSSSSLSTNFS